MENKVIQSLKKIRLESNINQSELGKRAGIPQSHVSTIEKGLINPRISTVIDITHSLEYELVLVPKKMLSTVNSLLNPEDAQKPMWRLDEEND
ncbi:MAG: hypothetical protein Ctma_0718 [Catillopecten margaritatus gill symbiont]|uniref:HTH cro/C1-type domain-containing protein n=1 Tax=Catillopecten margaritatus gill symbiont TaxID=3083288 RepID=A0AAU6PG59_9GAMM